VKQKLALKAGEAGSDDFSSQFLSAKNSPQYPTYSLSGQSTT